MSAWKIRDIEIKNQVVIAPLAGISNPAFRSILALYGPGLITSEMISDKAICFNNVKTLEMTKVYPNEHPIALQLFGEDVESMVKAAIYLDTQTDCDIIDINMGCPVPKIVKGSGGASLLKDPQRAFAIVKAVVESVKKPVTAKIRIGWDKQNINAVEMAIGLEKAGISAISVHGRTRSAMYSGDVDYEMIRQVKAAVKIPVIANGDIKSVQGAKDVLKLTGCDAVMIGRGILGRPWFINDLVHGLNDKETEFIDLKERFRIAQLHASKLIELKGELTAMKEMRTHFNWYIAGLPHNHKIRNDVSQMTSYAQFDKIIADYINTLENGGSV
ncbi:MAG: tRNA dihydrouridine synthase DusB [Erysipelotrichaceae bacterium]|nr:tRNA dihydrouridine synthase DusB [Erysipelotrichaceae bacterium]